MNAERQFLAAAAMIAALVFAMALDAQAQPPNVWTRMDPSPEGQREFPSNDPNVPEIWIYTDQMS